MAFTHRGTSWPEHATEVYLGFLVIIVENKINLPLDSHLLVFALVLGPPLSPVMFPLALEPVSSPSSVSSPTPGTWSPPRRFTSGYLVVVRNLSASSPLQLLLHRLSSEPPILAWGTMIFYQAVIASTSSSVCRRRFILTPPSTISSLCSVRPFRTTGSMRPRRLCSRPPATCTPVADLD